MYRKRSKIDGRGLLLATGAIAGICYAAKSAIRFSRRMDFRGRTVVITGGSRGLGLVMARQFAVGGANVAILSRDPSELARAEIDLRPYFAATRRENGLLAIRCDVTLVDDVKNAVRRLAEHFGGVDVLVNNAGTIMVGPIETMTEKDYDEAMRTHFWGPLNLTTEILPMMRARGEGRIVNISSIGGKIPVPHLAPYVASKFALTGYSETLRAELASTGIYVTTVAPGLMRTGSTRNALFKGRHEAEYAWFSIGDSSRLTSMNVERAAAKIIDACRHGQAELILTFQAKLASCLHGLAPGLSAEINALVARLLPNAGPWGNVAFYGRDSESKWSPSWLTELNDEAAVKNNEMERSGVLLDSVTVPATPPGSDQA